MLRFVLAFCALPCLFAQPKEIDCSYLAAQIVAALRPAGERVLMRYDPAYFAALVPALEKELRMAKATPLAPLAASQPLTEAALEGADVYIWLPLGQAARQLSKEEQGALVRWLGKGGARRELHFHWAEGTRSTDGMAAEHKPALDAVYQEALAVDYKALAATQNHAIGILRLGTIRISTPAGTDVMMRAGIRQFNRQNGDASRQRAGAAKMRVDREIELPAGVVRLAPIEQSVAGQLILPEARFGGTVARKVHIQLDNGRITRVTAAEGLEAVKASLAAGGDAAMRFREFGLGFNPKLAVDPGSTTVPYYGYGAGVVRLSFGDNEELGGDVRGGYVRWFFLTDATVHVDFRYLVKDGKLVAGEGHP